MTEMFHFFYVLLVRIIIFCCVYVYIFVLRFYFHDVDCVMTDERCVKLLQYFTETQLLKLYPTIRKNLLVNTLTPHNFFFQNCNKIILILL